MSNKSNDITLHICYTDNHKEMMIILRTRKNVTFNTIKMIASERMGVPINYYNFYKGSRGFEILIRDEDTPHMLCIKENELIITKKETQEDLRQKSVQEDLRLEGIESQMAVLENMEEMLERKTLTDFKILCKGQTFECHKLILSARSEYFKALFCSDMEECHNGEMEIKDMEPETVKAVIKFMYSGKMEQMEHTQAQEDECQIMAQVEKLLVAGDRFDMPRLERLSEKFLIADLSINNAMDRFILADTHNAALLKKAAKKIVIDNVAEIVESTEWKEKLARNPVSFCQLFDAIAKENKMLRCHRTVANKKLPVPLGQKPKRKKYLVKRLA